VIVLAVRWYLRFGLSFRDVEELLAERGVDVDHVTVYRWVQRLTPLAVVKIGSGIGCGLFINNELERGNSGLAGELGHIPSEPEGQRCSCGNRGCLQTLAGSDAIVGALQQAGRTDVQDIAAAAGLVHGGDRTAREVFQRAGEALGRGLATLLKGLNLEAIGLCGEPAILSSGFTSTPSATRWEGGRSRRRPTTTTCGSRNTPTSWRRAGRRRWCSTTSWTSESQRPTPSRCSWLAPPELGKRWITQSAASIAARGAAALAISRPGSSVLDPRSS
jgi:predicted NBD/HSP70 family sugar kinase